MSFQAIVKIVRENFARTVVIAIIITPTIFGLASLFYTERIETLKEQVSLLRQQIQFLEMQLKTPVQFFSDTTSVSVSDESLQQRASIPKGKGHRDPLIATDTPSGSVSGESLQQQGSSAPTREGRRYPLIANPKKLTKTEVKELAKFYKLFTDWKVNPQLRFKGGDISYWDEQELSEEALKREFDSRRMVLERAEAAGETIKTQGDLSNKAEEIQAQMQR